MTSAPESVAASSSTQEDTDHPSIIDLRGSTTTIENNHITIGARKGYIRVLTNFMLFLYDNDTHQSLLTHLVPLHEAKQRDTADFDSAVRRSRSG